MIFTKFKISVLGSQRQSFGCRMKVINFFTGKKGSALVLALVMVTVITIICSIVLMGSLLQVKFIRRKVDRMQALYLSEAGIYNAMWYLSGQEGKGILWRPINETILLLDNNTAEVTIEPWGGFLRVTSHAEYKKGVETIRVLLGEKPPASFQQAVHIGGVEYPLVLTGHTQIVGDITVGLKGVEKGSIKGRGFEGDKLVDGKITRVENPEMPYFDSRFFDEAFMRYRTMVNHPPDSQSEITGGLIDNGALQNFQGSSIFVNGDAVIQNLGLSDRIQGPLVIGCSGNMTLQGQNQLNRYTELVSGGKLVLTSQVILNDCILYAEKGIDIQGPCQIRAQLLSPGDITLNSQTVLEYPSVVYCQGHVEENTLQGEVFLYENAEVKGTVILHSNPEQVSYSIDGTLVNMDTGSKLVGAIYSNHYTKLGGMVLGCVVTEEFYLYLSPTTYLNWLLDATINRTRLPQSFLMPLLFSEKPNLDILDWEIVKELEG
jgi:hypothetical protein